MSTTSPALFLDWSAMITPSADGARIDPWSVAVLTEIMVRSGCMVVITSPERREHPAGTLAMQLVEQGLLRGLVARFDATDARGDDAVDQSAQIGRWLLDKAPLEGPAFAIIDSTCSAWNWLSPRRVQAAGRWPRLHPELVPPILARLATPWSVRERDSGRFIPVNLPHFQAYAAIPMAEKRALRSDCESPEYLSVDSERS